MSSFSVTKSSQTLVVPSGLAPPSGVILPLSPFDKLPAFRHMQIETIQVFERGDKPADVIRRALPKVLVPYYPLAGRLVDPVDQGELQVCCNGEGIWFVEAVASCTLAQVNYLADQGPLMIPKDDLLSYAPTHINPDDTMIVGMQVTEFKCGGFVVCVGMNHAIVDGIGMGQFLKAVGDMVKGLERPGVDPIWCREAIPNPPKSPSLPFEFTSGIKTSTIDISLHSINLLKCQVMQQTGRRCSTFDVLASVLWLCRSQAIQLPAEPESTNQFLVFPANVRQQFQLHHVLPQEGGYYGNCIHGIKLLEQSQRVCHASFTEVVSWIMDAKEGMPMELARWMKGDPCRQIDAGIDYNSLFVVDWRHLGFNEVDYGWGAPMYASSLPYDVFVPECILVRLPAPKQGVRVIAECVKKEHSASFLEKMNSIIQVLP